MKRRRVVVVLLCVVVALIFSFGQCYEKERIVPAVKVEKDTVIISFTTYYPSTDSKLFVAYEDETIRGLKAFPEYRYTVLDKKEEVTSTHQFELPIAPSEGTKYLRAVPVGVVTHFRISCIMLDGKKPIYVRSKDYTFRIIKTPKGEYKTGLCFTRPPVVTNIYDDKATIWWETNLPAQTRFIYWRDGQKEPTVIESKELLRRGEISLEGLREDTRYNYQIECISPELGDELLSPRLNFLSATLKPNFAFAVMGDSRADRYSVDQDGNVNAVNVSALSQLCRMAFISGAHFILFSGDLISGYTDDVSEVHLQYSTWCDAVAPVASLIPIYSTMGNHDGAAPWRPYGVGEKKLPSAETIWADVFALPENAPLPKKDMPPYKENVYSFNYGDCHFVSLNSDYNYLKDHPKDSPLYRTIDESQRQWLDADLLANRDKKFIFVFFHEPSYPTSVHQQKSLDRLPKERDALWEILDKYNIDAVFVGHEHLYTRLLVDKSVDQRWQNPIWQITSGRAGAPWYPINKTVKWRDNIRSYNYAPNFLRVEIKGRKALCKAYDIDGNVIDEFVLNKKERPK